MNWYQEHWIFIGRTDAVAPILWPPDAKNWLIGKRPWCWEDWRHKGTAEDEMLGWQHRLNGHEFEQAQGDGEGQGSPACCSPWGCKESDTTEQLNWTTDLDRKESACKVGDLSSIPGSGRSPGEGNGYSLQYPCLENSMDRGTWPAIVHGVTKNQTQLSNDTFTLSHFVVQQKLKHCKSSILQ